MSYDARSITVLEGLEAVRKRPGMYIGSTGERGLHHLVQEVVDNAVDEALAGFADTIEVTLLADGGVRVYDNGRGIPVDIHPGENRPAVEVVLTTLHAGGKFDSQSYAVSGGLHGVGVSVVNALSARLDVEIMKDGFVWRQSYADSEPTAPLVKGETTTETGTIITFWPDDKIFETTEWSFETLARRQQEMAFLNRGLSITLTDERPEHLTEASRTSSRTATRVASPTSSATSTRRRTRCTRRDRVRRRGRGHLGRDRDAVDLGLLRVRAHLRQHDQHGRGRHPRGGLPVRADQYRQPVRPGPGHAERRRTSNFAGEDVREGLTAIIHVKLSEPQFEGQTKTKLGNTEARSFVQKVCNDQLGDWFERYPGEAKAIVNKAIQAAAGAAGRPAGQGPDPQERHGGAGMPGKLADCQSGDPAECEIYVVEGDSAGGSAKGGRDSKFQAILPIRGKILNVEKARIDRVLKNNEVQSMITALGTGIHDEFDISKLRYHHIILMADADVDGQHITTLLLTLLFRFMKPLIEAGHVYLAQPPLYKIKWEGRNAARLRLLRQGAGRGDRGRRRGRPQGSGSAMACSGTRAWAR